MNRLKISLKSFGWVAMDLFFPRHCELCLKVLSHENRTYLCEACFSLIRFIPNDACRGCAKIFPGAFPAVEGWVCPKCLHAKRFYESCYAVSYYDGPVKTLLQTFKYAKAEYLAKTLKEIFIKGTAGKINFEKFDFLIAVPLHPRKFKERGFNQSFLLAQALAKETGKRILHRGMIRKKYSEGQTLQDKRDRLEKIQGSFEVPSVKKVEGKEILLIDDVLTTGATLQECSRILKDAGAKRVSALVLARSM
jgi:ComF family protein